MSKWAQRLAAFSQVPVKHKKTDDPSAKALTEPPKVPSVSFDSAPSGGVVENEADYLLAAMLEDLAERAAIIADSLPNTPEGQAEAERAAVCLVQCRACAHFLPGDDDLPAGIGRCAVSTWPQSSGYLCSGHEPRGGYAGALALRYCERWVATTC